MQLLLALDVGLPGAVAAYAGVVFWPLNGAGTRGEALAASLRAFLEHNGSWEEAAAQLGVHRHTLRQRLRRVADLTGRRLDSGRDRMELLLAFEARDLGLLDTARALATVPGDHSRLSCLVVIRSVRCRSGFCGRR